MTITDFLLARIAEDEVRPRGIGALPLVFDEADEQPTGELRIPARWLAECEAKRRIVEAAALVESFEGHAGDYTHGSLGAYRLALREMAAIYADHPDYRDEWRP